MLKKLVFENDARTLALYAGASSRITCKHLHLQASVKDIPSRAQSLRQTLNSLTDSILQLVIWIDVMIPAPTPNRTAVRSLPQIHSSIHISRSDPLTIICRHSTVVKWFTS